MSTKKPHMALGNRLKIVRKKLGLSQAAMADILGIATSTYQYYERGERDAYASTLINLTSYGAKPEWLLTGLGTPIEDSKIERNVINNDVLPNTKPPHPIIVDSFLQKDIAWDLNWNALKLERLNPAALKEINDYIKFKIGQYKQRKGERRQQDNLDAIPDGRDRRSGRDRRKVGT